MNYKFPAMSIAAAALLAIAPAIALSQGQGQVIVTVLPKHEGEVAPTVAEQDLSQVKVNGKAVKVTSWEPDRSPGSNVELVLLIDGASRSSLGRQMQDIEKFVRSLPPNIKAGIAYMENGRAVFAGPITSDHEQVLKNLHLPGGGAGSDASPYFCLSDLAKRWTSQESGVRHEVVMVTDGVDNYNRRLDLDDPYVQAAITDSVRAGLVVYSIYWKSEGRADNTAIADSTGQSLLSQVSQATGGKNFWSGTGNPVSFQPFLEELTRRLNNQYELGFSAPLNGKPQVETFKLKLTVPGAEVDAPQQVWVAPASGVQK